MSFIIQGGKKSGQVAVFDVTAKQKIFMRESPEFAAGSPWIQTVEGPKIVIVGQNTHGSVASVLDPTLGDLPTSAVPLTPNLGTASYMRISSFVGSTGEEGLLVDGVRLGSILKLQTPPPK